MNNQKTYINGLLIKKQEFQNGGHILKVSVAMNSLDELIAALKANAKGDWCNLVIAEMRSPKMSKDGARVVSTHCCYVDDFVPKASATPAPAAAPAAEDDSQSIPF